MDEQPVGARRVSRRRRNLLVGGVAALVLVLVVALGLSGLAGQRRLADAQEEFRAAATEVVAAAAQAQDASARLAEAVDAANADLAVAQAALAAAEDGYVPATEKTALQTAAQQATDVVTAAAPQPLEPTRRSKPDDAAEALALAESLRARSAELEEAAQADAEQVAAVQAAVEATRAAGGALTAGLPAAAEAVLAANSSTGQLARLGLLDVIETLPAADDWDEAAAAAVATYVSAAHAVEESHAAEEAEKAGPLRERRIEVETFARSIAGGVPLDFDWATIVNGFGQGGSHGGTATWDPAYGGFTTIALSDSIAASWGTEPAGRAVTVHEVGHAMAAKCYDMFSTSFNGEPETWATAWAIGMGYDTNGSGESLYGRPSDDLIALSTQCR